jgi:DNA-binding LytR/AlgR family response regulator
MLAKRKILIVEDEFIIADKLQEVLEENGYEVLGIKDNYDDAIRILKETLPDLALLDIHIKGKKDGIELAGYIHSHYRIPIIFLSAFDDAETIRRAKSAYPDAYLVKSKPMVEDGELIRAIKNQLLVSVNIAMPDVHERPRVKSAGLFYKAKEIDLSRKRPADAAEDPVDKEMLLRFDDMTTIESNNKNEHNTVLIRMIDHSKAFILRKTMKEIEEELPENFTRIHDSYIVNLDKITARRLPHKLFIGDLALNIGEKYKDTTVEKLRILFGS